MNKAVIFLGLGFLCSSLPVGTRVPAAESKPDYRVGLARKCITPEEPLWLAGYMGRRRPSEGVLDDLYAQALAVEDAGGRRALLLAVDLCVLRTATVNQVCRRITERTGLKREQILVSLSHTHSGPDVRFVSRATEPSSRPASWASSQVMGPAIWLRISSEGSLV